MDKQLAFTMEIALEIQADQLNQWKARLNEACYLALHAHCMQENKTVSEPYQVFRGTSMTNFIQNWQP